MSYRALNWAYTSRSVMRQKLSPSELAVLRALCWLYRDEKATRRTKNCFPGIEYLSKITGLKPTAVNKAKRTLRDRGLISWERASNLPGKPRRTNCYSIMCPDLEKTLKKNERRKGPIDWDDEYFRDDEFRPMLQPGVNYFRPDPEQLSPLFSGDDAPARAEFLADALSFTLDTPENRKAIMEKMQAEDDLLPIRIALRRVMKTSADGRKINNRLNYLLSALSKES